MPLLEYRCTDCGSVFERLVRRTEGADTSACPSCGGAEGRKMLSVFATVRGGDGASIQAMPEMPSAGGGCCSGGGCGCG